MSECTYLIAEIEDNDYAISSFVVSIGNGPVPLLACRVPLNNASLIMDA
jgi:hypothetical protein